jgi:predicted membrane-bound dolichyl-phosphate-mannose-protein mannosyltransferase
MPWHTIDGIFFAIISIFSTHKKYYLSAIILALFAASTKQSFYLFFIIFIIINFILIKRNIKNIKTPDIIISITLLIISVILITKNEIFSSLPDF